jgi:hypothetical protein
MISIFNEYQYAKDVLEKGLISNKQGLELFILAKYYRFECGKNKNECKNALTDFCNKYIDNYENGDFYIKVNSALNQAYKKNAKLLKIKDIEFSDIELTYIKNLEISPTAQKLLFCLWCCNKLNIKAGQSDKWIATTPNDLKKFSGLKSKAQILNIINELYNKDLVFVSDKWAIGLMFLDDVVIDSDDNKFQVTDFTTCGLWWEDYIGNKKVTQCKCCSKLFVKNSNRQRYCKDCAKEKELEKYDKYNQRRDKS